MDERLFRDAMGKFATGVTVLTTKIGGEISGMTANGFMSVSLNPKLVVISIGHKAKFLEKVSASKSFGVNILSDDQQHLSRHFAGKPGDELIQFNMLENIPVLDGVVAQIVCNVVAEHVEGDHTLFIGEVINLNIEDKNPLLFYSGKYYSLNEVQV